MAYTSNHLFPSCGFSEAAALVVILVHQHCSLAQLSNWLVPQKLAPIATLPCNTFNSHRCFSSRGGRHCRSIDATYWLLAWAMQWIEDSALKLGDNLTYCCNWATGVDSSPAKKIYVFSKLGLPNADWIRPIVFNAKPLSLMSLLCGWVLAGHLHNGQNGSPDSILTCLLEFAVNVMLSIFNLC